MLTPKPTPITIVLAGIVLLIIFISSASHYAPETASQATDFGAHILGSAQNSLSAPGGTSDRNKVHNSTLGFQKVFVIGLPERSDKRDAMALTSRLTGFDIEWVDGVKGDDIPDKAIPYGASREGLWATNLGSWRAHMNVARLIIEKNLGSALIMEDDVDWDVRIKDQLYRFVEGSRYIQSVPPTDLGSPYGDDWDILWLGHCGEVFPESLEEYKSYDKDDNMITWLSRKFVIKDDMTLPPAANITGYQDFKGNPQTRWIHRTGGPICSFAYALSRRGAQKVLYDLSVDHLFGAFDNALANLCRYGHESLKIKCISATPPYFFHHRSKGSRSKDSDIQVVAPPPANEEQPNETSMGDKMPFFRETGFTENIDQSARNNVKNIMMGLPPVSQFASPPPEADEKKDAKIEETKKDDEKEDKKKKEKKGAKN